MAQTTYNATNKQLSLTKIITNISPSDTPLVTLFGKGPAAKQPVHVWERDSLKAPGDNAQVEGFEYTAADPSETSLEQNVCQILYKGYGITETNKATKRENISDMIAYHMQKALKEIALDLERAVTVNDKMVLGSKAEARKMGGLPFFIKTNTLTNSAARPLTFQLVNDGLEMAYKAGGAPDTIVASARNKRVLSAVLPVGSSRSQEQKDKKLVSTIDVWEGDFGIQKIVKDRWLADDTVYLLDSQYFSLCYLREFTKIEKPKTHDAVERGIVGEVTLECRAENACAKIDKLDGKLPTK